MIVIGVVGVGEVPSVVAGEGGLEVDDVPTYDLPGRCEMVRNWV